MKGEYKAKYKKLIQKIQGLEDSTWQHLEKEPEWPDTIDDRKKVIQFRNEVFDRAFALGQLSAYEKILEKAEKL